ncbi:MAG: hypothetical protein ACC652_08640 [Acidimicrobiales bacterium]
MYSIRRWLAIAALVIMLPMAWQVAIGQIGLFDAGKRAAVLLIAVFFIGRILIFGVRQLADTLDGAWEGIESDSDEESEDSEKSS